MTNNLKRREVLQIGGVAAIAAAAGCYTSDQDGEQMLAPGSGDGQSMDIRLGEWRAAFRPTLSDLDVNGNEPTVAALTQSGEVALFNVEAGMSTNADHAEVVAADSLSDVSVDRFPTLVFLTGSGEMAVITEESYNGN